MVGLEEQAVGLHEQSLPFFRIRRYNARGRRRTFGEAAILARSAKRRELAKRNRDQALENTRFREIINFAAQ
jgi:hypothetical protein